MQLADLTMEDVEAFNRSLVEAGHSASLVSKRMQLVQGIVERAGRPEHGNQVLGWNWDSRDVLHGKPTSRRKLPTLPQLQAHSEEVQGEGDRDGMARHRVRVRPA